MRNLSLLTICLSAILLIGGCAKTETTIKDSTSNSTTKSTDRKTQTAENKKPETAASTLSPDQIDLSKPVPGSDLKDAVNKDLAAWTGKEVAVVGRALSTTPNKDMSSGKTMYSIRIARPNSFDIAVMCESDEQPPAEVASQQENRVFKGTIERTFSSGQVVLKNCEFVK